MFQCAEQETKAKKKRKKNTRKKAKITDNGKEEETIEISQSNDNQSGRLLVLCSINKSLCCAPEILKIAIKF